MTSQDLTNKGCWVIDRKISVGFILAIVIHALSVVAWLVKQEGRITALENTDARHELAITESQRTNIALEGMRADIAWIKENIQRRNR